MSDQFFNRKVGATFLKMLQHCMTCNAHNIYINCLHETIKTLKEREKKNWYGLKQTTPSTHINAIINQGNQVHESTLHNLRDVK